jgi:hypothetical protein
MSSRAKRWVMSGSGSKRPDSTVALSLPACALCRPDSFPDPLSFQFFRRRGHLADCQQLLRQSNDLSWSQRQAVATTKHEPRRRWAWLLIVMVAGIAGCGPSATPANTVLLSEPSVQPTAPTATASATWTPTPLPTWNTQTKAHVCQAAGAVSAIEVEAASFRKDVEAGRLADADSLLQRVELQAQSAEDALATIDWRSLPSSDAVAAIVDAAQSYARLAVAQRSHISSGTSDSMGMTIPTAFDLSIKRLETLFGDC